MKKLLLLALVALGGVMNASAQRATSGTIRVAFTDPSNKWAQSHFHIYVFGTSTGHNDTTFPGVDVTANTVTINGATYYYRDFPIATYGTGFKVIAVNDDGNGGSQSQSEDLNWCYDRTSITGDTYYSLKDEWDTSDHRKAELREMYYIADYENSGKVQLINQSGTDFSVSFNTADFQKFVVANSYAFKDDATLDFTANNSYPGNIYRPNSQKELDFSNYDLTITNEGTDGKDTNMDRWWNAGYWDASSLTDIDIDMSFVIENWRTKSGSTLSIHPSFERTLPAAAEGYATFSSTYDVTVPSGLTASYASAVSDGKITWANVTTIKAGKGALLQGTAGSTYRFTPATDADNGTDMMEAIPDEVQLTNPSGYYAYILSKVNNKLGFYKVNSNGGSWVNPGTAYLKVPVSAAREFYLFGDDELTSINAVENVKMEGQAYNLNGQRVAQPTKGLYIVNGKKVIIK